MKKLIIAVLCFLVLPIQGKAYETSATSAILMDMDSGRILYEKNIHTIRSVASISKIMTAILAVESGKLEETVTIGEEIGEAYGSGIYIRVGEQMTLKDLVYGLMLRSGNDAALAIAKYVGGSVENFIEMMNQKAKELKMKNSTFHNPSGLDEEKGNMSTAYDMAILTSYAMKNETYRQITGTKKYTLKTNMNNYVWTNKNKVLQTYKYATGGKTGFTEIARRTLVTTASKDHLNLVVVTLNDGNDFEDHKNLYEEAFKIFKTYQILSKGTIEIPNENYYKYQTLEIKEDYYYSLANDEKQSIILKFELEKKREYKEGDQIGKVKVLAGDQPIHEQPVYIKKINQDKQPTFWGKIVGWFKNLW